MTGVQDLTPGQMLLMGFNGLFTRLEEEFASLLESVDSLQVPSMWRKVDVIKEAKSLQVSKFSMFGSSGANVFMLSMFDSWWQIGHFFRV